MTKFADRLDVGGERKRGLRVIARSLTRVAERMNTSARNRDVRRLRRSIWSVGVGLKSRDKVCEGQMIHSVDHREKTFFNRIHQKPHHADIFFNDFICACILCHNIVLIM